MEQPLNPETSSSNSESAIGRRQLLKALATSGLLAATTQLPRHWTTPLAEAGKLPIHAQVSAPTATPEARFSGVCDSLPGGGDLRLTQGSIQNISPYLQLLSGIASLQGIPATMTVEVTSASAPTFDPPLPQTATTDSTGRASFTDLAVTGAPGDSFFLVFNFATETGNVHFRCGEFFFGTNVLNK